MVLKRVERVTDRGIACTLEHRPESEVITMSGGESYALELCGCVEMRGHRLGKGTRAGIFERGRVEVVQAQQMGKGNEWAQ